METGIKVITTYKGRSLMVVFSGPYSGDIFDAKTLTKCREYNELERMTITALAAEEIEFKNRKVA